MENSERLKADVCSRVAEKELLSLISELERYNLIADYYAANPKRIGPNREYLGQIEEAVLDLSPGSLIPRFGRHFGARIIELGPLILSTRQNLYKLRKLQSQN